MAINTIAGMAGVISQAGFEDVQVVEEETDFVYQDEAEWWAALRTTGVRWSLERAESGVARELKAEMLACVQTCKRSDGIHVPHRVLYALGRKAAAAEKPPRVHVV